MNHTSNYQLNQWAKDDRVRMEDFNADNTKIDAAIASLTGRVATLEQARFHIGGYTGTGSSSRTITLPWAPVFMIMFTKFGERDTAAMFLTQSRNGYLIKDAVAYDSEYIPSLHGASLSFPNDWANRQGETAWYIMFR